jgi:mycothiol synthase
VSAPLPGWFPELVERSRAVDGAPPFSDQAIVDARTGAKDLITIDDVAAAIVSADEAELVVHPDARHRGYGVELVETMLAATDPTVRVWAHGDLPGARVLAERYGFRAVRRLLQLRASLPDEGFAAPIRGDLRVRPFRPGVDENAWVELNARVFADHAEQGSVTRADVEQLETERWFDPSAFLLAWDRRELVGYCWLKIEEPSAPIPVGSTVPAENVGEIYVLGVAPERHGAGLGGMLLDTGLAELAARGIRTATLYVEGDNESALALYRRRGFTDYAVDVQYARTTAPEGR